jgi:Ca2+-binding EF-hand superfamily protein
MKTLRLHVLAGVLVLGIASAGDPLRAARSQPDEAAEAAPSDPRSPLIGSVRKPLQAFVSADADGDGVVTGAEAEAYFEARFALMDADRDGRLSGSEFVRLGIAKRRGDEILGLRSGRFSKFEQLDLDGDGSVSPEEFMYDRRARQAQTGAWAAKEGARREAAFRLLDADGAGFVDRTGFVAAGAVYFDAFDLDGDGEVTIWEFLSGQSL